MNALSLARARLVRLAAKAAPAVSEATTTVVAAAEVAKEIGKRPTWLGRLSRVRDSRTLAAAGRAAAQQGILRAASEAINGAEQLRQGNISRAEFTTRVAKTAARTAVEASATVAAAGGIVRAIPSLGRFAGGVVPMAVAGVGIGVVKDVAAVMKGQMDKKALARSTARSVACCGASIAAAKVGGAVGLAVAGPIGAAVFAVIGGICGQAGANRITD